MNELKGTGRFLKHLGPGFYFFLFSFAGLCIDVKMLKKEKKVCMSSCYKAFFYSYIAIYEKFVFLAWVLNLY